MTNKRKNKRKILKIGTEYIVSNAEWRYRHWCDRVLDERGTCEYCATELNLVAVAIPGITMNNATLKTLCVTCSDCIQDHIQLSNVLKV